eukprot:jgi/Undpi1/4356/HiC_scaffold_17.g07722.m1
MKIKTASTLSLAAALVSGVSCQRVLQEVAEIGFDISPSGATSGDEGTGSSTAAGTADLLIAALEGDEQVSVVGPVELGTLSCNSLANAANAAAVGMTIHGERIVADQTSYTLVDGGIFDDGISRHVWTGEVSDPEQAEDEAVPRTVSLSWGEECSVETFLLKITKRNIDGSTSMVKTVPCIDDSENQTCLVEVLVEFEEPGEVLLPEVAGDSRYDFRGCGDPCTPGLTDTISWELSTTEFGLKRYVYLVADWNDRNDNPTYAVSRVCNELW